MGSEARLRSGETVDQAPPSSPGPSAEDTAPERARLAGAAIGIAAAALLTVLGSSVFLAGGSPLILGPVVGIVAALACAELLDAAAVAAAGVVLGAAVETVVGSGASGFAALLGPAIACAVVAALTAAVARWLLPQRPGLERLLAILALTLVVAGGVQYAASAATAPAPDGSTFAGMLTSAPPVTAATPDEALYDLYVLGLRQGGDYYHVVGRVLQTADDARPGRVDLRTALSFRPPTLYLLMAALPAGGVWLVLLTMLAGAIASVSAYLLASRFAIRPLALAAATGVIAYYAGLATHVQLFGTELWAGAFGLLSLALLALSRDVPSRRGTLVRPAAAAALAASLFRELGVAFLLLGLVLTLADTEDRGSRRWDAWAVALAAAVAAWLLHRAAAMPVIATLHGPLIGPNPWFNPDGLGTVAAIARLGRMLAEQTWAAYALAVLGVMGALVASRDRVMRAGLVATVVGGLGILLFLYPPGVGTNGLPPSYWADVTLPTLLACVPLALTLLPVARRTDAD